MNKLLSLFVFILLLVGCNADNLEWYETKEDAIKYGLEKESSANRATLLSVDEFMDETIVFFELNNALGVASIAEGKNGFSWHRSSPYREFEGDSPYSTTGFNIDTKSGLEVSILAGKVFDTNIQTVNLLGDGGERELEITDNSHFFYSIHEAPFSSLKIIPISMEIFIYDVEDVSKRIVITDRHAIRTIIEAVSEADKEPGIVNIADPHYKIVLNEESYFLWLNETSGTIMNTSDTHTIYSLSANSAKQLNNFIK